MKSHQYHCHTSHLANLFRKFNKHSDMVNVQGVRLEDQGQCVCERTSNRRFHHMPLHNASISTSDVRIRRKTVHDEKISWGKTVHDKNAKPTWDVDKSFDDIVCNVVCTLKGQSSST